MAFELDSLVLTKNWKRKHRSRTTCCHVQGLTGKVSSQSMSLALSRVFAYVSAPLALQHTIGVPWKEHPEPLIQEVAPAPQPAAITDDPKKLLAPSNTNTVRCLEVHKQQCNIYCSSAGNKYPSY